MTQREAGDPSSQPPPPAPFAPPAPLAPPLPVAPLPVASMLRAEFSFEFTFEELREGLTQSPELQQQRKTPKRAAGLLGWVLFVTLAMLLFLVLNNRTRPAGAAAVNAPPAAPQRIDAFVAAGPSVLVAILVGTLVSAIAVAVYLATDKSPRARRSAAQLPATGAFVVILVGGIGAALLASRSAPSGWAVSYRLAMILALAPWVVVVALGLGFTIWLSRANLRRQWNSKPYLRRRRTIALDGDGAHATDGVADYFYRWPYFTRAWETANVLVLLDENDLRHVFPKRVMDQATLERARAVITNHIADCKFLTIPGGFPVTPAASSPA